ncbi:MAG: hypothetical protein IJ030_05805 [Oscillospiraceae bacterium]|nr:hypothetical protein [Oscillospiraceae bacterium]
MKWLETHPQPKECENCQQAECYNCDTAGKRWVLSKADELRTTRRLKIMAIARLQRQVEEIDALLAEIDQRGLML